MAYVKDSRIRLKKASMTGFEMDTIPILHRLPRAPAPDQLEYRDPKAGVETLTRNKLEQDRVRHKEENRFTSIKGTFKNGASILNCKLFWVASASTRGARCIDLPLGAADGVLRVVEGGKDGKMAIGVADDSNVGINVVGRQDGGWVFTAEGAIDGKGMIGNGTTVGWRVRVEDIGWLEGGDEGTSVGHGSHFLWGKS
jgi:hypothetical protein